MFSYEDIIKNYKRLDLTDVETLFLMKLIQWNFYCTDDELDLSPKTIQRCRKTLRDKALITSTRNVFQKYKYTTTGLEKKLQYLEENVQEEQKKKLTPKDKAELVQYILGVQK